MTWSFLSSHKAKINSCSISTLHYVLKPTWPGFSIVHNALNCTALIALIKSHISNLKFTHKLHDIMHKLQYSQG